MAQSQAPGYVAGYLTVQETDGDGMVGGLLLINANGRPLEFHCTLPVVPSRASRILHGDSLRMTLITECIGPALLGRARITPHVLFTDITDCVRLGEQTSFPVACVTAERIPTNWVGAAHGDCTAALPVVDESSEELLREILEQIDDNLQLDEPFSRIREALGEATAQAKAA